MQHPSTNDILDKVQRATISYFWEGGHAACGMAYDRRLTYGQPRNDLISISGSGFALLAIVVGTSRGSGRRNPQKLTHPIALRIVEVALKIEKGKFEAKPGNVRLW